MVVKKNFSNQLFKGGKILNIFGGSEINMAGATLAEGKIRLDVVCIFGSVKLILPPDWNVRIEVVSILGGFADKRKMVVASENNYSTKLVIRGVAIFGGGEISNE